MADQIFHVVVRVTVEPGPKHERVQRDVELVVQQRLRNGRSDYENTMRVERLIIDDMTCVVVPDQSVFDHPL